MNKNSTEHRIARRHSKRVIKEARYIHSRSALQQLTIKKTPRKSLTKKKKKKMKATIKISECFSSKDTLNIYNESLCDPEGLKQ